MIRVALISLMIFTVSLLTDINLTHAEEPPISVLPVYPDNQVEGNRAYFNLQINEIDKPHLQPLTIQITNTSAEKQSITIKPTSSTFSPHGSFEYNPEEPLEGQRITEDKYDMHNYLEVMEPDHILEPGDVIQVPVKFEVEEPFAGQMMGSIAVYVNDLNKKNKDKQFGVITQTRYIVAVVATFNKKEKTKFEFKGKPVVLPQPQYYDIMYPIHHATGSVLPNTQILYQVLDKATQKVLFKADKSRKFNFSPYSETYVSFPWLGDELVVGKEYTLTGTITYTDDKDKEVVVPFGGDFIYTGEEDYLYNGDEVAPPAITDLIKDWWWVLLLILLLLLIPLIAAFFRTKYIRVVDMTEPVIQVLYETEEVHQSVIELLRTYEKNRDYAGLAPEGKDTYGGHLYVLKKRKVKDKKIVTYEYKKSIILEKERNKINNNTNT